MPDRDPLAAALTTTFTADTCKQLADYLTVGFDTRDPRSPLIRRLRDALDTAATPRPVPTTRDRLTDARTCDALCRDIEVERDDLRIQVGREQADNRAMMRDRDQALAERDEAREQLVAGVKARTTVLTDEIGRWKAKLTEARADRDDARRERDDYRQELGAAGEVIAVVRDAVERIDRALAVYDTTPGEMCSPPCTLPKGHPNECDANQQPHEDPARLREQLAEAHADCARYATERDEARSELERLSNANDTLALTLAEAIGALTPDGGGCSRGWIPGPTVDRWRRALHEAEEARTPALGSLPPRAQEPGGLFGGDRGHQPAPECLASITAVHAHCDGCTCSCHRAEREG